MSTRPPSVSESDFQPFKLVYDIRVIGPNSGGSDHIAPSLLVSLAVAQLFVLFGVVYNN